MKSLNMYVWIVDLTSVSCINKNTMTSDDI